MYVKLDFSFNLSILNKLMTKICPNVLEIPKLTLLLENEIKCVLDFSLP